MCGIVGLISRRPAGFWHSELDMFQNLLHMDVLRGEDSTGAYSIHKDGGVNAVKIGSHPQHLFATKEWEKFRSQAIASGHILVGHNRKATQGAVNTNNAHPFLEGKYIMVHNGTLRNYTKWKSGKEVDSNALCWAFNEYGHEAVLPEIEGAFALAFYNLETEKFYLIRNSERPLWLVRSDVTVAFASEAWMPKALFERRNEKIGNVESLMPGQLMEWGIESGVTMKKVELDEDRPKHSTHYNGSRTYAGGGSGYRHNEENYHYDYRNGVWRPRDMHESSVNKLEAAVQRAVREPNNNAENIITFPKGSTRLKEHNVGDDIQIKVDKITREVNPDTSIQQYKVYGKTCEFGHPEIDVVGWLHPETRPTELVDYHTNVLKAVVQRYVNSNCGPSMWVRTIDFDDTVRTWNGVTLGAHTWKRITEEECCTKCSRLLDVADYSFSSVNLKNQSSPKIVCHQCIANNLKGELRADFLKRRNSAVQTGKPVSEESKLPTNGVILLAGPTTVQ